jgi:hypothetical protein
MSLGSTQLLTETNISLGKGGWCVELTNLPPTYAACHEIWEPQPPGTLRASPEIALLYLYQNDIYYRLKT